MKNSGIEYAAYMNDTLEAVGTKDYLAEHLGVMRSEIIPSKRKSGRWYCEFERIDPKDDAGFSLAAQKLSEEGFSGFRVVCYQGKERKYGYEIYGHPALTWDRDKAWVMDAISAARMAAFLADWVEADRLFITNGAKIVEYDPNKLRRRG